MDPIIGGALISAGSQVIGGLLGSGKNNHAGRDQRQAISYANRSAILDKVAAAKEAGISPLYALGAPTISATSQVGEGGGNGLGQTLAGMGQDIGRAVAAQQTDLERKVQQLTLDKAALENDYLRAQINSVRVRTIRESGPPMPEAGPAPGPLRPERLQDPSRTKGLNAGIGYPTNPYFSDAQSFEDRYGDSELASMYWAVQNGLADLYWNVKDQPLFPDGSPGAAIMSGPGGSWSKTWDYIWNGK